MKVAIYTRVSTDYQADKDSLPMQRKDLIAYARLVLGCDDYEIFEDAGYSGKNTQRPGFQDMMLRTRQGEFSHILVWKIDRISRNLLDFAQMYAELKKLGVTFVSKNEQFDTSSAMGEAMLKIILVFAELERNMTSERVTATMISRASSGLWNGGRVPYGYDYDKETKTFSINSKEASIVQIMHNRYEELHSLIFLCHDLNNSGYRTRSGALWTPNGASTILNSYFYCGDYIYNVHADASHSKVKNESEWVTINDHHPAIIDRDQKKRICDLLTYNDRGKHGTKHTARADSAVHIFGGISCCGKCGKPLYSSNHQFANGTKYTVYLCQSARKSKELCDQTQISDVTIGEFVFNFLSNIINAKTEHIQDRDALHDRLLQGAAFRHVDITPESMDDLVALLASNDNVSIFRPVRSEMQIPDDSSTLMERKTKLERALQRLTDLYLFSEADMSERDYVTRKARIEDQLQDVNADIESLEQSIPNAQADELISAAGNFIIAQSMKGRSYISFRRLLDTVDAKLLYDFVHAIISTIYILDRQVTAIEFSNGLFIEFTRKRPEG